MCLVFILLNFEHIHIIWYWMSALGFDAILMNIEIFANIMVIIIIKISWHIELGRGIPL